MAVTAEQLDKVRQGVIEREGAADPESLRRLIRVEINPVEHFSYEAHSPAEPQFKMMIDEPKARGGGEQGPSPTIYFLTGSASCLLNQFLRLSIAEGLDIRFTQMQAKGEFQRKVGGGFVSITQEIYAEGSASQEELEKLTEKAESFCYVHMTLNKVVTMTTVLYLNGNEVVRQVTGPDNAA